MVFAHESNRASMRAVVPAGLAAPPRPRSALTVDPSTAAQPMVFSSMSSRMSSGVAQYRPSSAYTYRSSTSK